jgi:hypothetical protein
MTEDKDTIPEPTPIESLEYDKNLPEGGSVVVALVEVINGLPYRF